MSSATIPDFSDRERHLVQQAIIERYKRVVAVQEVDVDLQLNLQSPQLTTCPALYWEQRGAEFVVCKTGDQKFRGRFFYGSDEDFGTAQEYFDSLGDCVVSLLQTQADHEAQGFPGASTAPDLPRSTQPAITGEDYDGPLVI